MGKEEEGGKWEIGCRQYNVTIEWIKYSSYSRCTVYYIDGCTPA